MGTEGFTRKITAIMSADVVGYSKLMGDNETATVQTLTVYKKVMSSLITQHRGRVIDSPGDNMLSEFASVVDAVQCAVAIQKELKSRNAELPENRKMRFRIGINLGDVIEEQDRIFGDGVNIAARLESLANPGGICVSKTAFDHIETKLPLGYEYIGKQSVKNIEKPVDAYRVLMESRITVADTEEIKRKKPIYLIPNFVGISALLTLVIFTGIWYFYIRQDTAQLETESSEKIASTRHYKPSYAVLPFDNISKNPEVEYLCDGMTETLIANLSKVPDLLVIARNSTFAYKGKEIKIREIAEELGVQYVIEGSVQKSDDRLRLTVQIIDALSEHHVFSEQFDREFKDIFDLQDEIILEILKSIEVTRTGIDKYQVLNVRETDSLDAYVMYLKAANFFNIVTEDSLLKAKSLCEKAIEIDPKYAQAYQLLSLVYQYLGRLYSSGEKRKNNFEKGLQLAHRTIELDDSIGPAYITLGLSYLYQRNYDSAISELEKAIELDPSEPWIHSSMALCLIFSGKFERSIYHLKKAILIDPLSPAHYIRMGRAYFHLKRYEDSINAVNMVGKLMEKVPYNKSFAPIYLAMIYSDYRRENDARAQMKKVLEIEPNFNLEARRRSLFFKNPADADREINALRKAGAPEHPPSK